jgi:hypothetical protein
MTAAGSEATIEPPQAPLSPSDHADPGVAAGPRAVGVDPTDLSVPPDGLNRYQLLQRYNYVQNEITAKTDEYSRLKARRKQLQQLLGQTE